MPESDADRVIFEENWNATRRVYKEIEDLKAHVKILRELITMQAITFEGGLYYLVSAPGYDDYLAEFPE